MNYTSDFEDNSGGSTKRKSSWKHDDIAKKCKTTGSTHSSQLPSRSSYMDSYEKEERKAHIEQFLSMSAYARHKKLVHDYLAYYGGKMEDFERSSVNDKTDYDVIKENHKFIWDDHDDSEESWGKKLAKKYYDKLYKEYCICDLSQYKHNKVAMRWRVEKEVMEGKGQFSCGSRKCQLSDGLKSWEVNFVYSEHGEKKQALVKLRLCPDCSYKLNYTKKHNKAKKLKRKSFREKSINDTLSSSQANEQTEAPGSLSKNIDSIWTQPLQENLVEKTREEEFDEYLEDLFL
ncbi:protein FRA10AC1 isoform X1 [Hydra vulgaris]|uniref:protein FRA10AC1 isoform X1 n=1 Tax=Hydra vulgaris TaxID=6087 RepID=UPI0002B46E20|nr:protein FRA10AC1 [Hydra vulgaris]